MVLPYSWDLPTKLSGPPIPDSPASHESRYCHALIHRKEGDNESEGGMVGWQNACFWFGQTGYHPLFPTVKGKVKRINHREEVVLSMRTILLRSSIW